MGLRAELVRTVLEHLPSDEVLAVLPETAESLDALAKLGQEDIGAHLEEWQQAQAARLRHLTFQLLDDQRSTIDRAIERAGHEVATDNGNPNKRGNALWAICQAYLNDQEEEA